MILLALLPILVADDPNISAGSVISEMLAKYSKAQTFAGAINFVQDAGDVKATVTTKLQMKRISKLYIRQERKNSDPFVWLITSDGSRFSYNEPMEGKFAGGRLMESVRQVNGVVLDYKGIYAACALSLGDRSAATDIIFSRIEDLKYLRNQWATLDFVKPKEKLPDGYRAIGGQWRQYGQAPVSGTWMMWIDANANLKRYTL